MTASDLGHDRELELAEAIADLPQRFFDCRLGNHSWSRGGDPINEGAGLFVILWRCRCGSERHDRVTRSGTLYARWYRRPKGYDLTGFGHATQRKAPYRKVLLDGLYPESTDG